MIMSSFFTEVATAIVVTYVLRLQVRSHVAGMHWQRVSIKFEGLTQRTSIPMAAILQFAQGKPRLLFEKWLFAAHIIIIIPEV